MNNSLGLFFTYQPFWEDDILKDELLLREKDGTVIAVMGRFQYRGDLLCVPGIGLTCITFPYGEDAGLPAYCHGPVQTLEYQFVHNIRYAYVIRFLPGMFGRYFHISGLELSSKGTPLDCLLPNLSPFVRQAAEAKDLFQFRIVMERMLSDLLARRRSQCSPLELTWKLSYELLYRRGNMTVQEMADYTGFCRRHLRDVFLTYVGISPKQLCNQVRFQNTMQSILLESALGGSLTDISLRNGYFDQSHFNRMFKRYTGMCPSKFIESVQEGKPLLVKNLSIEKCIYP